MRNPHYNRLSAGVWFIFSFFLVLLVSCGLVPAPAHAPAPTPAPAPIPAPTPMPIPNPPMTVTVYATPPPTRTVIPAPAPAPTTEQTKYFRILESPTQVKIGEPIKIIAQSNYHHYQELRVGIYAIEGVQYVQDTQSPLGDVKQIRFFEDPLIGFADSENKIIWYFETDSLPVVVGPAQIWFSQVTKYEETQGGGKEVSYFPLEQDRSFVFIK